ncbi:MAG: hypothetical protein RIR62_1619 [Pseudomonadota bacterium]
MIRPLLVALTLAPAGMAGAFELALPVDCTLGETCHVQNHFDRDSGPGWQDFGCGALSYDGHDGTDFALPTRAAMEAGVNVLAAAGGTVRGVRDGMPDIPRDDPAAPPLDGRECGNGVAIDHGNGWETQYCHLMQGSIAVRAGDRVETGAVLGRIGLSGNTVFPHVHIAVRKDGVALDPFAPDAAATCGAPPETDLWAGDIAYDGFGFLDAGFADAVPDYGAIRNGLPPRLIFPADAPALVVWAYFFGARQGDRLTLSITGPEGEVIRQDITLDRTQAQAFRATGRKARGPWPAGAYRGEAVLLRDGAEVGRTVTSIAVE